MKIRYNVISITSLILSFGLLSLVPASLHWTSTWRQLNLEMPGFSQQNYFMPLGFFSLGLEIIGLIVIWTGYMRGKRQAWFVMLIVLMFLVFPLNVLKPLLEMHASIMNWSNLFYGIRSGWWPSIWAAIGFATFLMMLSALLLSIKAFWGNSEQPLD